ncbi:SDN1 [Symbiodinium sp. CCMP2456]|nr:SDN1 [Symbiodinium sp. CCMP2456]
MEGRALKLALRSSKEGVLSTALSTLRVTFVAEQMIHNSEPVMGKPQDAPSYEGPEDHQLLAGVVRSLQAKGQSWAEWLERRGGSASARDPARHEIGALKAFLEDCGSGDLGSQVLRNDRKRRKAKEQLKEALGSDPTASRLLRLVELTRAHPNFGLFFGLAGLGEGRRRSRAAAPDPEALQAEDVLVAVDCEMVSTDLEEDALARVCVCNARGELLLDRLVRPPGKVTDARSSITGIEAKDLEVDYRLEDAQADILGLIHPLTVVVGHTLHKDLDVLRLDAPLVLDISLLYGVEGQPKRRPALAQLVQHILGQDDFRATGTHDCAQDVLVTMQIALQRLRGTGRSKEMPAMVWVPPPPASDSDLQARTLFLHRIPRRAEAFGAITKLFTSLRSDLASQVEGITMVQGSEVSGTALQGARALFLSAEAAEKAFLALAAESIEVDKVQRPQKMVRIHFGDRDTLICVRPCLGGVGKASLAAPQSEKRLQADVPEARPVKTARKAAAKAKGWPGWRRAAEEALRDSGGSAPWKDLLEAMVARRRTQAGGRPGEAEESRDVLELRALSALPEEYLSDADPMVRQGQHMVRSDAHPPLHDGERQDLMHATILDMQVSIPCLRTALRSRSEDNVPPSPSYSTKWCDVREVESQHSVALEQRREDEASNGQLAFFALVACVVPAWVTGLTPRALQLISAPVQAGLTFDTAEAHHMRRSGRTHQLGEAADARSQEVQEFRSAFLRQTATSALVKPSQEIYQTPRALTERASSKRTSSISDTGHVQSDTAAHLDAVHMEARSGNMESSSLEAVDLARFDREPAGNLGKRSTSKTSADSDSSRWKVSANGGSSLEWRVAVNLHRADCEDDADVADIFSSQVGQPLEKIPSQSPYESPANSPPAVSPMPSGRGEGSLKQAERRATESRLQLPTSVSRSPRSLSPPQGSNRDFVDARWRARQEISPALEDYITWLEARQAPTPQQSPLASGQSGRKHSSTVNSAGSILFPERLSPQPGNSASLANSLASSMANELLGSRALASRSLQEYILWLEVQDAKAESGRRSSLTINSLASSSAVDLQATYEAETSRAVEKYCAWRQLQDQDGGRLRHLDKRGSNRSVESAASNQLPSSPSSDAIQRLLEESGGSAPALREYRQQLGFSDSSGSSGQRGDSKKRVYTVINLPPLDEVSDDMIDGLFASSDPKQSSGNNTSSANPLSISSGSRSTARAQVLSKSSDGSGSGSSMRKYVDPRCLSSFGSDSFLDDQMLSSEGKSQSLGQMGRQRLQTGHAAVHRNGCQENGAVGSDAPPQNARASGSFYGSGSVIKQDATWPSVNPANLKSFESDACADNPRNESSALSSLHEIVSRSVVSVCGP